jgi:hypothetical protein
VQVHLQRFSKEFCFCSNIIKGRMLIKPLDVIIKCRPFITWKLGEIGNISRLSRAMLPDFHKSHCIMKSSKRYCRCPSCENISDPRNGGQPSHVNRRSVEQMIELPGLSEPMHKKAHRTLDK